MADDIFDSLFTDTTEPSAPAILEPVATTTTSNDIFDTLFEDVPEASPIALPPITTTDNKDFNYAVLEYQASPAFIANTPRQHIQALQSIYDSRKDWDEGASQQLANVSSEYRRDYNEEPEFTDLKQYLPPLPEKVSDKLLSEDDRLDAIKEWETEADTYGAVMSRTTNSYSDYLSKEKAVLETKRQVARQLRREVKGEDVGKASDIIKRYYEGGLTFIPSALGATGLSESIADAINENPKFDEDAASQIAFNLGQGVAQMGTAAVVSSVASPAAATAVLFAGNASLAYQEAYNEILLKTGDPDKAIKGGLLNTNTAFIETVGDVLVGGKLLKSVSKLSKAAKVNAIAEAIKETTEGVVKGGITKEILKPLRGAVVTGALRGAASEAITEPTQGAITRGIVQEFTGGQGPDPLDPTLLGQEASIAGAVGGILGGGASGFGISFSNNAAVRAMITQLREINSVSPEVASKMIADIKEDDPRAAAAISAGLAQTDPELSEQAAVTEEDLAKPFETQKQAFKDLRERQAVEPILEDIVVEDIQAIEEGKLKKQSENIKSRLSTISTLDRAIAQQETTLSRVTTPEEKAAVQRVITRTKELRDKKQKTLDTLQNVDLVQALKAEQDKPITTEAKTPLTSEELVKLTAEKNAVIQKIKALQGTLTEPQLIERGELETRVQEIDAELQPAIQNVFQEELTRLKQRKSEIEALEPTPFIEPESATPIEETQGTEESTTVPVNPELEEINTRIQELEPPTSKEDALLGISAASASTFRPTAGIQNLRDRGFQNDVFEGQGMDELFDEMGGADILTTTREEQDHLSSQIRNEFTPEEVASSLIGDSPEAPLTTLISRLPEDIRANLIGHTQVALQARQVEAESTGNVEEVKNLRDLRAQVDMAFVYTGSVFGKGLGTISDIYHRILPTGQKVLQEVQDAFNAGRTPPSDQVKALEKTVIDLETEIRTLKAQIEQQGILVAASEDNIDKKEKELKQAEAALETAQEGLAENTKALEEISDTIDKVKKNRTGRDTKDSEVIKTKKDIKAVIKGIENTPSRTAVQQELWAKEETAVDSLTKARQKAASLKTQIKNGKGKIATEALSKIENQLTAKELEITTLEKELKILRDTIASDPVLKDLKERRAEAGILLSKLKQSIKRLPTVEQLVENQRAKALELEAQIATLSQEYEANKTLTEDLREIIRRQNKPLKDNTANYKRLLKNLNAQQERLITQRERLAEARKKIRSEIDLKTLPSETLARIQPLLDQYEKIVDSGVDSELLKRNLLSNILGIVALETDLSVTDILGSIWYLKILSGIGTQEANITSGGVNAMLNILASAASDPSASFSVFQGMIAGAKRGLTDAKAALMGDVTRLGIEDKLQIPSSAIVLLRTPNSELTPKQQKLKLAVQVATFGVGDKMLRLLSAADIFFYRTAEEARAHLIANRLGERGELKTTEGEVITDVSEILHNSTDNFKDALEQAKTELNLLDVTNKDSKNLQIRRAFEIIDNQRNEELVDESRLGGAIATYTGPPTGMMGLLATSINRIIRGGFKIGDFEVLRVFVPFVDIVGRVADAGMNYTPIGLVRGLKTTYKVYGDPGYKDFEVVSKRTILDSPEAKFLFKQREEVAKSLMGAATLGVIWGLANQFVDDDDPYFAIYGPMSKVSNTRRTALKEAGIEPFSIKIGDQSFIYKETPMFAPLAFLGSFFDAKRFDSNYDEKSWVDLMSAGVMASTKALSESSFLEGVSELIAFATGDERTTGSFFRALEERALETGRGLVVGSLPGSLSKLGEQPVADQTTDLMAYVFAKIPFATELGLAKPQLNIFGAEVKDEDLFIGSRYYQETSKDEDFRFLARNNLTVNAFGKANTITVGIGKKGSNLQQMLLTEEKELRKAAQNEKSGVTDELARYFGRLAYDKFTPEERYELVKLAGPGIREAVQYVRANEDNLNQKQKQELLDKLVTDAKIDARATLLSIPNINVSAVKRYIGVIQDKDLRDVEIDEDDDLDE